MSIFESIPSVGWQVILVGSWLGLILIFAEGVNRVLKVEPEVTRKIVHIGTGNVILLAWWLNIPAWVGIGAAFVAGTIALISYQIPILPSINSVGRHSWGTFFYAVSIGILIAWFWPLQQPYYAALGILVMTWGDGMAAAIGQRFGKHRYQVFGMQKSWEGSLTMGIVSYLVCCLIFLTIQGLIWQTWIVSGIVAIAAILLESFSKFGFDNLTVPLGAAAIAFFLNQLL